MERPSFQLRNQSKWSHGGGPLHYVAERGRPTDELAIRYVSPFAAIRPVVSEPRYSIKHAETSDYGSALWRRFQVLVVEPSHHVERRCSTFPEDDVFEQHRSFVGRILSAFASIPRVGNTLIIEPQPPPHYLVWGQRTAGCGLRNFAFLRIGGEGDVVPALLYSPMQSVVLPI